MIRPATPILTAAEMRDAEQAAVADGVPLATLMDRAGCALGELTFRAAAGRPIHFLVGSGNNGGDGYIAARHVQSRGGRVALSAIAPPSTPLARAAAAQWAGRVGDLSDAAMGGAVLVDCLFGTGLNRPLDDHVAAHLRRHAAAAGRRIAADLPSGLDCDGGNVLGCPYGADITLAFGALKPAHLLFPAASHCGIVHVADISITALSRTHTAAMPPMPWPDHDSHKYTRGMVAVVGGAMPGAAELAARGAVRAGAGYVQLIGGKLPAGPPFALVRRGWREGAALADPRLCAIAIGPGLGRDAAAQSRLDAALATGKPVVIDADAIHLLPRGPLRMPAIITPHAGEFAVVAPAEAPDKISSARACAEKWNAVIIYKGADTVIAAPDGRVAVHSPGDRWLSCAGTGDVLAGIAAACLARGLAAFDAAQAAVLLHQRAARRAGPGLVADDLVSDAVWP